MSEVLGLLFAVILAMTQLPTLMSWSQSANNNTRATATAQQHQRVIEATTQYIQRYSSNLQSATTGGRSAVVTVPMLQSVSLLDGSFSATNPFGQTWQVEVRQPSSDKLAALILSTGGDQLDDRVAAKISALVGQQGGFVPKNDSGLYASGGSAAYGSFGGWTLPTSGYALASAGRLAAMVSFSSGQLTSNYLYRNAVQGQPQLNRMGTNLDMGANNISNAGSIDANGRITAGEFVKINGTAGEGASCPSNGLIGMDGSGSLLTCKAGSWKKQAAGGCVFFTGDLNWLQQDGCYNGGQLGNGPTSDWLFVEVMRHVNYNNFHTIQRATAMNGGNVGQVWLRSQQSNESGQGWGPWRKQVGCMSYSGANLNNLQIDGCYNGNNFGNAPISDWLFVEVIRHVNMNNYFTIQRATAMTGEAPGQVWVRSQQSDSDSQGWGPWAAQLSDNMSRFSGNIRINNAYIKEIDKWLSQIRGDGGQYVLRKMSDGSLVGPEHIPCQSNPKTGGCSCPSGFIDKGFISGQSYMYNYFDSFWETHVCMPN